MAVTSKSVSVQAADQPTVGAAATSNPAASSGTDTSKSVPAPVVEFDGYNCVVSDGTAHMGRALPGKYICSAHEMHYLPDGTPRAARNVQ